MRFGILWRRTVRAAHTEMVTPCFLSVNDARGPLLRYRKVALRSSFDTTFSELYNSSL